MKVVIVGNGPAAVSAIKAFRKVDKDSDIVVLSAEEYPAYAPNCMENVIRGDIGDDALFYAGGFSFYEKYKVDLRLGKEVVSIDNKKKIIYVKGGEEVSYDKCLLAAGASAFIPPIPGVELGGVTTAKSLDDAKRIRKWILEGRVRRVVIVGAGPIGIEDAETLRYMGLEVSVVEVFDRVLPRMLDKHMADLYMKPLEEEGIRFYLNSQVVAFHGEDGWVEAVEIKKLGSDRSIYLPADMVILSTGVRPRTYLVEGTDIRLHVDEIKGRVVGGVLVDEYQRTSDPDVYAAGDICSGIDVFGRHRWIALFPTAQQAGAIAGYNMAGLKVKNPGLVDYNAVKTRMVTAGSGGLFEEADESHTFELDNQIIKIFLRDGVLIGYQFVGLPKVLSVNKNNPFLKDSITFKFTGQGLEASGVLMHHFMRYRDRKVTQKVLSVIKNGALRSLANPSHDIPLFSL
ncbi:NAD(P)/FAD-dependent oxidoreductase [Thermocrinis minervae]|uniref:NADH-dependent fumarate reductase subunit D n=1 Tax=Thermocrinis minervae TaxID=381751 RepID=A0A1M6TJE6_9AQUI|nr:FAD-dependent oxidoreductase [Thermocrinis minervae]SHK56888.1 NADH-dependent fumarate reductase subunit D [Thermocrinis minervae]